MFGSNKKEQGKNKMSGNGNSETSSVNIIGAGTVIEGDIKSGGDMRIDGTLIGTIELKGKVVIGPTGKVEGEVNCQNADISGTVKANVVISDLLSLKSSAKLLGDITTKKLSIEPGASFTGKCSMGGVVKDLQHDRQEQQPAKEEKREEATA